MAIEVLTDDLLAEILQYLPLYFLLQCKIVSKQFLRVISDPCFFRPRLPHHQLLPRAFEAHKLFLLFNFCLGSNYDNMMFFSVDSNYKPHILKGSDFPPRSWAQDRNRIRVKATYFDLVLCSTQTNDYIHYFVCNPFTKQCVALPTIRKSRAHELTRVGFICDQSRSRFRVVHIPIECFQYVSKFQVNMFSSETGEWSASDVTVPNHMILMSNSCSSNILVYNQKFVWWMKERGFLVCDPFDGYDFKWRIITIQSPCVFLDVNTKWDVYNGICNGRVKICAFSRTSLKSKVYDLVLEDGTWSANVYYFDVSRLGINNMNLFAIHPQCEYMMYLYTKKGIFLCDYKNQKMESVYTVTVDEDIHVFDNVMSLVLPGWPTPVPTLNAAELQE